MGVTGAVLCQLVLLQLRPPVADLEGFALYSQALAEISGMVLFPSLGVVVLSGFLSVGINRAFHSAPWVFIKLMFSVLVFESTLAVVIPFHKMGHANIICAQYTKTVSLMFLIDKTAHY